jgi:hypothetical protein
MGRERDLDLWLQGYLEIAMIYSMEYKKWKLIWLFSFLIILQVFWLDNRLDKLITRSPIYLEAKQKQQVNEILRQVAEPPAADKTAKEGGLWLEPGEASIAGRVRLAVWGYSKLPIVKAQVRLFFPRQTLQSYDASWQVDNTSGAALLIKDFTEPQSSDFLLATIDFITVNKPINNKTVVTFDFVKDSLLDSNLLTPSGEDVLGEVRGGEYAIIF